MKKLRESSKVVGERYLYEIKGCGLQYKIKFAGKHLALITHKKRPVVVLLNNYYGKRMFENINTLNVSEAKMIITWLARFISIAEKEKPIAHSFAEANAHLNATKKNINEIAKLFGEDTHG